MEGEGSGGREGRGGGQGDREGMREMLYMCMLRIEFQSCSKNWSA